METFLEAPEVVGRFEQSLAADLAEKIGQWSRCRKELAEWEDTNLIEDDPPTDKLAQHKDMVERLIFFGQVFSLATSRPEFPNPDLAQQVQANLWLLRGMYQMFHNPMDAGEADQILKEVFPES